MSKILKHSIRKIFQRLGYDILKHSAPGHVSGLPSDFSAEDQAEFRAVSHCTMVPPERIYTLVRAVEYVINNNIEGALVECGTWKGGCALCMARTLKRLDVRDRFVYLYDLFGENWPRATEFDVHGGVSAQALYDSGAVDDASMRYTFDEVKKNVLAGGYPEENINFIAGDVMKTIPDNAPKKIALLRLDTDFYESTLHELEHLYPRLVPGGVLILDDYGDWEGARKAADEYFAKRKEPILLTRVDVGARMAIKTR